MSDEELLPKPKPASAPAPRRRRSRGARLLTWLGGGLLIGAGLAFLLVNLVARTSYGHEKVLGITLKALGKSIKGGQLQVGRIEGNLFEGAKLYNLRLVDRQGREFIVADSAWGEYDVRTLLSPRIVVDSLTLFNPRIWVFQMPGDSLWNYQTIFSDTAPRDTTLPRVERLLQAGHIRLVNADVRVELPFRADSTLSPRAQRRFIQQALADTSPVVVRQVPRGYLRTVNMRGLHGVMRNVRFAPGSPRGSRFTIDTLRGNVHFYRRPIEIRHLQGNLALFNDHVEFDFSQARLPSSRLATSGVVRFKDFPEWFDASEGPAYDIAFRGDSVAFRDLRWMNPRFPADARGRLTLLIESRPAGVMITARNANLTAPGTRIAGSFGMVLGDTLQFVDVDVRARPVRVSLIERLLPEGLPVRGLVLGGFEIRGNNAPRIDEEEPETPETDATPES
jgi:hypothetical protein